MSTIVAMPGLSIASMIEMNAFNQTEVCLKNEN